MKILLFGKAGQVGWDLQRSLSALGELTALDFDSTEFHADFGRPVALSDTVRALRPDVIVNAAAHKAVDKAESERGFATALNAEATRVLAVEAAALGAWLVHYSTDYVFDGSGDVPRDEDAATSPLGVYGRTKLDGESRIRTSGCQHLIFRTNWVYGARGGNFARTILRLAAERESLVVDITAHAVRAVQREARLGGTYHAVAAGETSWRGYARFVVDPARAQGPAVKAAAAAIRAVPSTAYPTPARRPLTRAWPARGCRAALDRRCQPGNPASHAC